MSKISKEELAKIRARVKARVPKYPHIKDYPIDEIRVIESNNQWKILTTITRDGFVWNHRTNAWASMGIDAVGSSIVAVVSAGDNKAWSFNVNKKVGEIWIPNPNKFSYIIHLNGDRMDFSKGNMVWSPTKTNKIGKRYGKLVVTDYADPKYNKKRVYLECLCDCGQTTRVAVGHLNSEHTTSCGCAQIEAVTKHGLSENLLYRVLLNMKSRCYNKADISYANYGAKGIVVCDEWKESLPNFIRWAMANGYRESLSIDRIDVNQGYSPDNCRWANKIVQARNTQKAERYDVGKRNLWVDDIVDIYEVSEANIAQHMQTYGNLDKLIPDTETLWKEKIVNKVNRNLPIDKIARHRRRKANSVTCLLRGEEMSVKDAARKLGVSYRLTLDVLNKKGSIDSLVAKYAPYL